MSQVAEAFVRVRPVGGAEFARELDTQTRPGLQRFERQLSQTNREVTRFERGVLAGSGVLGKFSRAAIFASSSVLGGYGLTFAYEKVTEAARSHEVVTTQLTAAVKAAGVSYALYGDEIEKAVRAQEDLGFAESDAARSFTLALRATKDATEAQKLQSIAADVARGRNMSLLAATQLLVRVQAGQVGSLRRLGIEVAKGVTGQQALVLVQKQYAGAAEAFSHTAEGAQERLNVAIHRTEVIIGEALTPTIEKLDTRLANWLDNSKNQERLQRDVNKAVQIGGKVAHDLSEAVKKVADRVKPLVDLLGGIPNAMELAFGLVVLKKLGLLRLAIASLGPTAVKSAAVADASIASIGTTAATASGAAGVGGLITKLGLLARLNPITVGVAIGLTIDQIVKPERSWLEKKLGHLGFLVSGPGEVLSQLNDEKNRIEKLIKYATGNLGSGPKGVLGFADVAMAIYMGLLTMSGLQKLKSRFRSDAEYQLAVRYLKEREAGLKDSALDTQHGVGSVTGQGRAGPLPITGEALIQQRLTDDPNNVAAIRAQIAYDQKALDFALKQYRDQKITRGQYLVKYHNIRTDQLAQQNHLDQIAQDAAAKRLAAAKAAQTREQRAHLAYVEITEHRLRDAAKSSNDSKKADDALVQFLKDEYHDKQLSGVARALFHTKLVAEVHRQNALAESRENFLLHAAETAAKTHDRLLTARDKAIAKAKKKALDLKQGALDLEKQAADLAVARAGDNKVLLAKAEKLEEKADLDYIAFYRKRIAATKGLEQQGWKEKLLAAQIDLANLRNSKKAGAASGYTLQQLFAEAGAELATYGSNVGTDLSAQDARAEYGATVQKHSTTIVNQNFYDGRHSHQALTDAYQVAKNMK